MSHFTPTALSLGGPTDLLDVLTREGERGGGNTKMSERYTFLLFTGVPTDLLDVLTGELHEQRLGATCPKVVSNLFQL